MAEMMKGGASRQINLRKSWYGGGGGIRHGWQKDETAD
jgi:hypothetical protein